MGQLLQYQGWSIFVVQYITYFRKIWNLRHWDIPLMSASPIPDNDCMAQADVCYEAALVRYLLAAGEESARLQIGIGILPMQ